MFTLAVLGRQEPPTYLYPDSYTYQAQAVGETINTVTYKNESELYFRLPPEVWLKNFYPQVTSLVGEGGIVLINIALIVASASLLAYIFRKSPWKQVTSTVLVLCSWWSVLWTNFHLNEVLSFFLVTVVVATILEKRLNSWTAIAIAIAAINRPEFLIFGYVYLLLSPYKSWKKAARFVAIISVGVLVSFLLSGIPINQHTLSTLRISASLATPIGLSLAQLLGWALAKYQQVKISRYFTSIGFSLLGTISLSVYALYLFFELSGTDTAIPGTRYIFATVVFFRYIPLVGPLLLLTTFNRKNFSRERSIVIGSTAIMFLIYAFFSAVNFRYYFNIYSPLIFLASANLIEIFEQHKHRAIGIVLIALSTLWGTWWG